MKTNRAPLKACLALLLLAGLAGCATPYRSGADAGVYYQPSARTVPVAYVDPLLYPFWSLDYFYYSRYYHPYSVLVHRYDPWYYPYPGWYYGYHPGRHHAGHRGRTFYPWNRHSDRYASYRPWESGVHFSYTYGFGEVDWRRDRREYPRVREIDARLSELQTERSLAIRSQRPGRGLVPMIQPRWPATHRGGTGGSSSLIHRHPAYGSSQADRRASGSRAALIEQLRSDHRSLLRRNPSLVPRVPSRTDRAAPVLRIGDERSRSDTVQRPPRATTPPTRPTRERAPSRRDSAPTRSSRRSSPPPQRGSRDTRRID